MKPPPFDYLRPATLNEALRLLGERENCRVLAGGQSLMPMLNFRYVYPDALIDINRIDELAEVALRDGKVSIGAMARQRHLERSALIEERLPIMSEALRHVGHRQTRNRGTIGGSLCHLDPSAELPTLCLLYDADIEIASLRGRRGATARDFIQGYMTVDLAPDEMVTRIDFAYWNANHRWAFLEHARRRGDFAIASAACLLERDASGLISRIAIAVGGLADRPIRLSKAEALLSQTDGASDLVERAVASLSDAPVVADIHADEAYRAHVAATLVRRALGAALAPALETVAE